MISTVTTTTVTTVVTLATGASLSVLVSLLLISLLGTKEIISTQQIEKRLPLKILSKNITVGILPLTLVFALIVASKVLEVI